MLLLKSIQKYQDRSMVLPYDGIPPMFHFHYAYGFVTQSLAHMLDSLVRVSRRVDGSHFVSIPRQRVNHAAVKTEAKGTASCPPHLNPPCHADPAKSAASVFLHGRHRVPRGVNAGRALEGPARLPRRRSSPPSPMDADRSRPKCSRREAPAHGPDGRSRLTARRHPRAV